MKKSESIVTYSSSNTKEVNDMVNLDKFRRQDLRALLLNNGTNGSIIRIDADGNCLFKAVVENYRHLDREIPDYLFDHTVLRIKVIHELRKPENLQLINAALSDEKGVPIDNITDTDRENYFAKMSKLATWGGTPELYVIAKLLQIRIIVHTDGDVIRIPQEAEYDEWPALIELVHESVNAGLDQDDNNVKKNTNHYNIALPEVVAKELIVNYHNQKILSSSDMPSSVLIAKNTTLLELNSPDAVAAKFLRLVVEEEQDLAEAMLKEAPGLALRKSFVTDLSGCSFHDITGFQYALWALDSDMWKMIFNYLPKEAACTQIKALEIGSWVKEHGKSATWEYLIINSVLWWAVFHYQGDIVTILLDKGADVNATCTEEGFYHGTSIVWIAACLRQWELVTTLMSKGADINSTCTTEGPHQGQSILWLAAFHKQWDIVTTLMSNGADINATCIGEGPDQGKSILWFAASHHKWELVITLMHKGADVNATCTGEGDDNGKSILWFAAFHKKWHIIIRLVNMGADVNATCIVEGTDQGKSILWLAAFHKQPEIVTTLMNKGADVNATCTGEGIDQGKSILWLTALQQYSRLPIYRRFRRRDNEWNVIANSLMDKGADVNAICIGKSTDQGKSILWLAAFCKRWDLVKELMNKGADINVTCTGEGPDQGKSILWLAAFGERWDLVKELMDKGADINAICTNEGMDQGKSILWLTVFHSQSIFERLAFHKPLDIVVTLIDKGADVNATCTGEGENNGKSILWLSAFQKHWKLVKTLMDKGANVNATCTGEGPDQGKSILWLAAYHKQWDIVKTLMDKGVNVNATCTGEGADQGKSILWLVASHAQWKLFARLIQKGASINIDCPAGENKQIKLNLWQTIFNNHGASITQLISNEANVNFKGTAEELAQSKSVLVLWRATFNSDRKVMQYELITCGEEESTKMLISNTLPKSKRQTLITTVKSVDNNSVEYTIYKTSSEIIGWPSNLNKNQSLAALQLETDSALALQIQLKENKSYYQDSLKNSLQISSKQSIINIETNLYHFVDAKGNKTKFSLILTRGDRDCFFHAVNQDGFTREALISKLLNHSKEEAVLNTFAIEIYQFLYLGYTKSHEDAPENKACSLLLNEEISRLFATMQQAEYTLIPLLNQARDKLGQSSSQGKLPAELLKLLCNESSDLTTVFAEKHNAVLQANNCIYKYCSQEKVFLDYVKLYLDKARGYIPFSRDFGDTLPTTTIDIINQLFNLNIQVYLRSQPNKPGLVLANLPYSGDCIPIFHNGVNHFSGLNIIKQKEIQLNQQNLQFQESIKLGEYLSSLTVSNSPKLTIEELKNICNQSTKGVTQDYPPEVECAASKIRIHKNIKTHTIDSLREKTRIYEIRELQLYLPNIHQDLKNIEESLAQIKINPEQYNLPSFIENIDVLLNVISDNKNYILEWQHISSDISFILNNIETISKEINEYNLFIDLVTENDAIQSAIKSNELVIQMLNNSIAEMSAQKSSLRKSLIEKLKQQVGQEDIKCIEEAILNTQQALRENKAQLQLKEQELTGLKDKLILLNVSQDNLNKKTKNNFKAAIKNARQVKKRLNLSKDFLEVYQHCKNKLLSIKDRINYCLQMINNLEEVKSFIFCMHLQLLDKYTEDITRYKIQNMLSESIQIIVKYTWERYNLLKKRLHENPASFLIDNLEQDNLEQKLNEYREYLMSLKNKFLFSDNAKDFLKFNIIPVYNTGYDSYNKLIADLELKIELICQDINTYKNVVLERGVEKKLTETNKMFDIKVDAVEEKEELALILIFDKNMTLAQKMSAMNELQEMPEVQEFRWLQYTKATYPPTDAIKSADDIYKLQYEQLKNNTRNSYSCRRGFYQICDNFPSRSYNRKKINSEYIARSIDEFDTTINNFITIYEDYTDRLNVDKQFQLKNELIQIEEKLVICKLHDVQKDFLSVLIFRKNALENFIANQEASGVKYEFCSKKELKNIISYCEIGKEILNPEWFTSSYAARNSLTISAEKLDTLKATLIDCAENLKELVTGEVCNDIMKILSIMDEGLALETRFRAKYKGLKKLFKYHNSKACYIEKLLKNTLQTTGDAKLPYANAEYMKLAEFKDKLTKDFLRLNKKKNSIMCKYDKERSNIWNTLNLAIGYSAIDKVCARAIQLMQITQSDKQEGLELLVQARQQIKDVQTKLLEITHYAESYFSFNSEKQVNFPKSYIGWLKQQCKELSARIDIAIRIDRAQYLTVAAHKIAAVELGNGLDTYHKSFKNTDPIEYERTMQNALLGSTNTSKNEYRLWQLQQKETLKEYGEQLKLHYANLVDAAVRDEIENNAQIFDKHEENYLEFMLQESLTLLYDNFDKINTSAGTICNNVLREKNNDRLKQGNKGVNL